MIRAIFVDEGPVTGKMTLLADVSSECKWIARTQPIIATLAKCWSRTSVIKPWPSPGVIDLHDRHTQGVLAFSATTLGQFASFRMHFDDPSATFFQGKSRHDCPNYDHHSESPGQKLAPTKIRLSKSWQTSGPRRRGH